MRLRSHKIVRCHLSTVSSWTAPAEGKRGKRMRRLQHHIGGDSGREREKMAEQMAQIRMSYFAICISNENVTNPTRHIASCDATAYLVCMKRYIA